MFLKQNSHYGNPIAKDLILFDYKIKHRVKNLFRIKLPCYWRMLYTLTRDESKREIIAFVLEICDHKRYDK